MNRPMRFKAWCYAKQEWASFLKIDQSGNYKLCLLKHDNAGKLIDEEWRIAGEEDTLVQWTGIYDSLGKEIWEGDILDSIVNEGYFKVVWRADLAKFVARMDGIYDAVLNEFNWKVKGNIFEHPELLE